MKRVGISLIVIIIVLAAHFIAIAQSQDPNQVVAVVNGEEILQSSVDLIIAKIVLPQFQVQNPGQEIPEEQKARIEQNIINQLVIQELILQSAAESNLVVDEAEVDKRFETVKAQQPEGTDEQMRQLISRDILIQQTIQQNVVSKIEITDEEAQNYYNENKDQFKEPAQVQASHILVQVAQDASQEDKDAALKKIQEVLAMVKEGKDFAELAKEYSDCPSKENGGDLGFFPRGAMVKPFEDVAFTLNEGEISDVVETQFGYHILKVTGKKEQQEISFEEAKDRLKQGLLEQKTNQEIRKWIEDLKAKATIEIMNQ